MFRSTLLILGRFLIKTQTSRLIFLETQKIQSSQKKVSKDCLLYSFVNLFCVLICPLCLPASISKVQNNFMRIPYLILFIALSNPLFGMDVIGKIVDNQGTPIVDAYVLKMDGSFHASSNELGIFTYKDANVGDTLVISYLGYEDKQIIIEETSFQESLTVVLEDAFFDLAQVHITNSLKSINQLANIDLITQPVNSSQEILRKVPGLFIGQHAGGGKAEQLFLRGFDIDHGTDIAVSVDGIPVNMVSHAHGQGYADLHFLIPETVQRLDFGKGPYYADKGNFTTAGYVNFQTKDQLENSSISLEAGRFNTQRAVALIDLLKNTKQQHAYIAGEYLISDGPFESPQNFHRLNLMGKYTANFSNNDKLTFLASYFDSEWTASGQIPQRAIDNGLINRFGAIDDTEGGTTGRTNIALNYTKNTGKNSFLKSRVFYSNYHFDLFSNFTFFANDPINGDQIRQTENRNLFGVESVWHNNKLSNFNYKIGAGLRQDHVNDVGLWRTLSRNTILSTLAQGTVKETNYYSFINTEFTFGKWMINPALRIDYFDFNYADELLPINQNDSENDLMVNPKLNIIYTANPNLQFFAKSGIGFHSNDSRVVLARDGKETLPGAFGADVGTIWKPTPKLWVNTALWYLFLQQEFVYVGDEGIVEPSGKTRRFGVDVSLRGQLSKVLFFNTDFNYTIARSIESPKGEDLIPLAPELTMTGGLSMQFENGLNGGINYRFIKDRPATESNSIVAEGYFITDLNVNYQFKKIIFGVEIQNLFNQEWNEAQFATESRLFDELEAVEELHFTPGAPFFFKGKVTYNF